MGRSGYSVGDLVGIESGYRSGVWLRSDIGGEFNGCMTVSSIALILGIVGMNVKVIGGEGEVGWILMNRLRHIE